jgi:hypothetical protein
MGCVTVACNNLSQSLICADGGGGLLQVLELETERFVSLDQMPIASYDLYQRRLRGTTAAGQPGRHHPRHAGTYVEQESLASSTQAGGPVTSTLGLMCWCIQSLGLSYDSESARVSYTLCACAGSGSD